MAASYASVQDVITLFRALEPQEVERAEALLPIVSDLLRQEAHKVGRDLDRMILLDPPLAAVARAVTVDAVGRVLRQSTTGEPVSQESQTALGYTWQGTYAIPGGGVANAIMRNDLKRLGIYRQRLGVIDLDSGHHGGSCDPHADGHGRL